MFIGGEHILTKIESANFEQQIIQGEYKSCKEEEKDNRKTKEGEKEKRKEERNEESNYSNWK